MGEGRCSPAANTRALPLSRRTDYQLLLCDDLVLPSIEYQTKYQLQAPKKYIPQHLTADH